MSENNEIDSVIIDMEKINDLVPTSDKEAWLLNYKHNWCYNTTRLLEIQNIEYTPFVIENTKSSIKIFNIDELYYSCPVYEHIGYSEKGYVYTDIDFRGLEHLSTDVVALKGEIKWIKHHTPFNEGHKLLEEVKGNLELKFAGIIAAHFRKYTGIINFYTIGDTIIRCALKPSVYMVNDYGQEWVKKVNKLYSRKTWSKK